MKSAIVVLTERLFRECFVAALRMLYSDAIIHEMQSVAALPAEAEKIAPDLIFLILPEESAQMYPISTLCDLTPRSKIIIIADQIPEYRVKAVLRQGAHGLLRSQAPLSELADAIDEVEHNRRYIDQKLITYEQLAKFIEGGADSLTPRELQTLELMAQGLTNKEIARKIIGRDGQPISIQTVKNYVSNILAKFHVASRQEAIIFILKKRNTAN